MSDFSKFELAVQRQFEKMSEDSVLLYETDVDKDQLWNVYLESFPEGTNPMFRQRREYDCSCCRHFIKNIGNVVSVKNNVVSSIWDIETDDPAYQTVTNKLSEFVKSKKIVNVYHAIYNKVGTACNYENNDGEIRRWDHFYLNIPAKFIDTRKLSDGDYKNQFRTTRDVFKRSLDELTQESVETVLELIGQNSLYRGEEWQGPLNKFLEYKKEYEDLRTEKEKETYSWEKIAEAGQVVGKIRNHSIGTLLIDISEGEDLDSAVRKYEAIVAPANYKRPKAIFTKKMVEEAQKKIIELGFENSLGRRHATLDDITVNNILFSNKDSAGRIVGASDVFAEMKAEASKTPKNFDHVEEISAADFVEKVLPTAQNVELWMDGRHKRNMVSLIAPKDKDAKTMFKWNNGFSWAYTGNVTDSMKERVKEAGGKVDGVLRFSIQWNDGDDWNKNDFDAHCITPAGREIFYAQLRDPVTYGNLDVDIRNPRNGIPAVENITWPSLSRMRDGKYKFFVENYWHNGGRSGFKAEIEFDGTIYSYEYNKELKHKEQIQVAEVTLKNGRFTIENKLPAGSSSQDVWNVKTNQFVPVSVIMYSPNYWDGQNGIGNKHYFFMLKDCVNPENPNGFYNEFLCNELLEYKRVLEALGSKLHVEDSEDQLSGVGFSSTQRNEAIVRVAGSVKRVLKVKF